MKNETDDKPNTAGTFETQVREAFEAGKDIQEAIRQLTLRQISERKLDLESLRQVASTVLHGARAGAEAQLQKSAASIEATRTHLKQAVSGLDAALAQCAEASKLALEEATSKAQSFSREDLTRARNDFAALETMFVETLQKSASATKNVVGDILTDIAEHSRIHGSSVGHQIKETLSVMTQKLEEAGRTQVEVGLHLAHATTDLVRQFAAGMLSGLADRIKPGERRDKEN
ncbi:MAG: DUF6781 family protein [Azonexus sp.]